MDLFAQLGIRLQVAGFRKSPKKPAATRHDTPTPLPSLDLKMAVGRGRQSKGSRGDRGSFTPSPTFFGCEEVGLAMNRVGRKAGALLAEPRPSRREQPVALRIYLTPAAVVAGGSGKVSILSQFSTGSSFSFTMQTSYPSPPSTESGVPTDSKVAASMKSLSGPP